MKTEILKDVEEVFLAERVAGSGIFSDLHSDMKYLLSLKNIRKPEPSEYEVSGEWVPQCSPNLTPEPPAQRSPIGGVRGFR